MLSKSTEIGTFIIVTTGLIMLLIGFIVLIFFLYKKKQLDFYNHVETLKNDYEKNLLSSQLEIQEQTLKHISGEIHDNIGLLLSAAKLNLATIDWNKTESVPGKIDSTLEQIKKAIDDLRQLSQTLNAGYISEHGLFKSILREMDQIARLGIHQTSVEQLGEYRSADAKKEVMIFRIIQEALHNSIKHAKATSLIIIMAYDSTHLQIQICDNGKQWKEDPESRFGLQSDGQGLKNMQQRALLLNGHFSLEHQPGQGTTVRLTVPY